MMNCYIEESLGTASRPGLLHYILMIGEEVIDVISPGEPEVFLSC